MRSTRSIPLSDLVLQYIRPTPVDCSVAIIGGGPAGCAAGRLLAAWGHSVLLLDNSDAASARARGLAESLPPSVRKALTQTMLLDAVDRSGFYRSSGNTVVWRTGEQRVETFGGALGYQVFRPDLDAVLLGAAREAGAAVRQHATVREVECRDDGTEIRYRVGNDAHILRARWILDCSGRAGVLARRYRTPGRRTYALVGEWTSTDGWRLPDPTHTLVEAYRDGWSWSIPISPSLRHAGVMIDGASPRRDGRALVDAYRAEVEKSEALRATLDGRSLNRAWACDASTYSSTQPAGRNWLMAGDAASFVDPLSSAGVNKALTSAWLAAVVANTCLNHPERTGAALEFFGSWEADVCAQHAARSRAFAAEAATRYPTDFWLSRAGTPESAPGRRDRAALVDPGAVRAALESIRENDGLELAIDDRVAFEPRPVVRGREIVLEDSIILPAPSLSDRSTEGTRFVDNVDVVALARLAGRQRSVPDLFAAYCQSCGPTPLPNVLSGLSWLVASGILRQRNAVTC
jgi:flavin-dependent dehydrogenase